MCGIAGIFAYAGAPDPTRSAEVARACARMQSRGPDGSGLWSSDDLRVTLGHRRLAIIDLADRAAQPMASADSALRVTFNGEIYNFRALREELAGRTGPFHTESDTEVLLHMYAARGESMLGALRGMFAFALWDERKGALLLARDPYGIKPLYYADDGRVFRFASQVKALEAGGGIDTRIDPAGAVGFYLFGSVPEPFTIRRGVRALPAGCFMWVDERGASEPRVYFDLARAFRDAAAADSGEPHAGCTSMREALLDSVQHHMVADVPVGVFLSAGIDSGALAGLMRESSSAKIDGVTVAFDEFAGQAQDEAPLAARVAARYGLAHARRMVARAELEADLPRILDAMDQPSIDGMNTWFASKAARELGLKVAISGLGGDEMLGGYPSFRDIPRMVRLAAPGTGWPRASRLSRRLVAPLLAGSRLSPKLASVLEYGGTYPGAYLLRRGLFMPWELPALLDRDTLEEGLARLRPLELIASRVEPDPGTAFGRVAALEASLYMRNQLLRDTDWASMAHSLEVRTPLVDTTLLRALAPYALRAPGTELKAELAACPAPPLPPEIAQRSKTGFTTPLDAWLAQSPELDDWRGIPTLARAGCHWSRRWSYTVLQRQQT